MQWYEILNKIKEAKGKEKQIILEENKDNKELKKVLRFLYSPRIVTGISKKKWEKQKLNEQPSISCEGLTDHDQWLLVSNLMDYLLKNNTGKDTDVIHAKKTWHIFDDNELASEMIKGIIIKDLPIGISAGTINKVFPKLIPQFKLQKGQLWKGEITEKVIATLKLDGNSATIFNLEDETYMLSRSGATMLGFDHILDYYKKYLPKGYVYFGELILKNFDHLNHGPLFQLSNGITNSKNKEDEKENLQHVVFDMVPFEAFERGIYSMTYEDRYAKIERCVEYEYNHHANSFNDVEYVPLYVVTDEVDEIEKIASEVVSDGLEGLMLCNVDSIWKAGSQKWLQKVKEFNTADVLVKGINEHVRGNKVGSLIIDWKGNEVGVPGISDELRDKWWNKPDEIVGKIVEIKYFRETEDKNGKLSVRFPSFIRIREDKTFEEISYE